MKRIITKITLAALMAATAMPAVATPQSTLAKKGHLIWASIALLNGACLLYLDHTSLKEINADLTDSPDNEELKNEKKSAIRSRALNVALTLSFTTFFLYKHFNQSKNHR